MQSTGFELVAGMRALRASRRWAAAVFTTALCLHAWLSPTPSALAAQCSRPCGKPVSTQGSTPTTGDALFTLRTAVGVSATCYLCECDVNGNDTVTSTDALAVLRSAVGLPIELDCPACSPVQPSLAYARGVAALERESLRIANDEFDCAVELEPELAAAQFFRAITRVAVYVAADADLRELLVESGGTGSSDIYNFTLAFQHGVDVPTVARARPVLLQGLTDELAAAIEHLEVAVDDANFIAALSDAIAPEGLLSVGRLYEVDAADAAIVSAAFRQLRCILLFTIGSYHPSTFDRLREAPEAICDEDFVADHASFFTVAADPAFAAAKAECKGAISDLITAIDLIEDESDGQGDDLFVVDDVEREAFDLANVSGDPIREVRDVLVELRQSFENPTDDLPSCDEEPFPFALGKLFDAPLTRADLPDIGRNEFTGKCQVDEESFPDPSFHGLLPGAPDYSELGSLTSNAWPICQTIPEPPPLTLFFGTVGAGSCDSVVVEVDLAAADAVLAEGSLCGFNGQLAAAGCDVDFASDGETLLVTIAGCTIPAFLDLFHCQFHTVDISDINVVSTADCDCTTASCDPDPPLCVSESPDPGSCEDCDNGIDDDVDGDIDCEDEQCSNHPDCTDNETTSTTTTSTSTSTSTSSSTTTSTTTTTQECGDIGDGCDVSEGCCEGLCQNDFCEAPPAYDIVFEIVESKNVGSVTWDVDYGSSGGIFVGASGSVQCTKADAVYISSFVDGDQHMVLSAGIVDLDGVQGPNAPLATCRFRRLGPPPQASDFAILNVNAADPDIEPIDVTVAIASITPVP
ncbi:MAG TPA: hypothetical protein VEL28_10905 [Candidatus Binatia bacterium]|nr:hypothetical protein [Candidatus Binatia bacterium]